MLKWTTTKEMLKDILVEVAWGTISTDYFGKSRSWLSKKLSEVDDKGNSNVLTEEEKETLRGALVDLAERIRTVATNIE